jgi:hypothetical protein
LIALTIVFATSFGGVPISVIILTPETTLVVMSLYTVSNSDFLAIFIFFIKFVFITPGSIMITSTPNGANSNLKDSLNPSNANLELMYAGDAGNPIRPTTELMFTIVPDP